MIVPVVLHDSEDKFWVVVSDKAPWDADDSECIEVKSVKDGHRVIALLEKVTNRNTKPSITSICDDFNDIS